MAGIYKSASQKKEERKIQIERMKERDFGCDVKIAGYRCAYRSSFPQEIRDHVKSHLKHLESGKRNKSRYWEVKIEDCDRKTQSGNKKVNRFAIADANGKEFSLDQELVFTKIEQVFQDNLILVENSSESTEYATNKSLSSMTSPAIENTKIAVDPAMEQNAQQFNCNNTSQKDQSASDDPLDGEQKRDEEENDHSNKTSGELIDVDEHNNIATEDHNYTAIDQDNDCCGMEVNYDDGNSNSHYGSSTIEGIKKTHENI